MSSMSAPLVLCVCAERHSSRSSNRLASDRQLSQEGALGPSQGISLAFCRCGYTIDPQRLLRQRRRTSAGKPTTGAICPPSQSARSAGRQALLAGSRLRGPRLLTAEVLAELHADPARLADLDERRPSDPHVGPAHIEVLVGEVAPDERDGEVRLRDLPGQPRRSGRSWAGEARVRSAEAPPAARRLRALARAVPRFHKLTELVRVASTAVGTAREGQPLSSRPRQASPSMKFITLPFDHVEAASPTPGAGRSSLPGKISCSSIIFPSGS